MDACPCFDKNVPVSKCRPRTLQFRGPHRTLLRSRSAEPAVLAAAASAADRCILCVRCCQHVNVLVAVQLQKIACNKAGWDYRIRTPVTSWLQSSLVLFSVSSTRANNNA